MVCFFTISNDGLRVDTLYNSAKNNENVLRYYERNGFVYLMNPDREAEYYRKEEQELDTRIMFFDLMQLI